MTTTHQNQVVQKPAYGTIDYLKLTGHEPENLIPVVCTYANDGNSVDIGEASASAQLMMSLCEDVLLSDIDRWWGRWTDLGHGRGPVVRVLEAIPGIQVHDFNETYAILELTGRGCGLFGPDRLSELISEIDNRFERWGSSRVDIAWDGFPASVDTVREALNAGKCVSSLRIKTPVPYFENSEGRTVYTGVRSSRRLVRWYDRRGPVRIEIELKGDYATALLQEMCALPVCGWPARFMSLCADLLHFSETARRGRSTISWWSEFVGDVEGERLKVNPRNLAATDAIQRCDGHLQRHAVVLNAMLDEYGAAWLTDRIHYWKGARMCHSEVDLLAAELNKVRGSNLGGVPDCVDDIPI